MVGGDLVYRWKVGESGCLKGQLMLTDGDLYSG